MNNRTIKFRAWDTIKKKMYSAEEMGIDELQLNPDGRGFFNAHPNSPNLSPYYPHLLPLQFIGLTDKNEKEIYEGDIVKHPNAQEPEDKGFIIKYMPAEFIAFCVRKVNNEDMFISISLPYFTECEIIGNIHQNPELLTN